jgi:NAD(P)-dependent dehydrogenase (short-subunit alcohol dehydrogenase family)
MTNALEGKVAVITGGNSGMGLAAAKRFTAEGAHVVITGCRQEQIDDAHRFIETGEHGIAQRGAFR